MKGAVIYGFLTCIVHARSTGTGLEIEPGYNINMSLLNEETVQFDIVLKDQSWLGIHLGGLGIEKDGDIIRFTADGDDSEFFDEHGGFTTPRRDFSNDLTATFQVRDGEVIWRVRRKLDTGD